jgi:putative salt-induced outer membrane protein YdiY
MRKKTICLLLAFAINLFFIMPVAFGAEAREGWSGDISAGYNQTSGNTEKAAANLSAEAVRKFSHSQILAKGNIFYSQSNKQMDGQKWDALGKYSFDFGEGYKCYSFLQTLIDHDYFADIDYRLTPAIGVGYHISATGDFVWDVDAGLGYRITRHRINKSADDEVATAIGHTYLKKNIYDKAFFSEDLTVYPGLKSGAALLIKSESAFTNPLSDKLSLELKFIVDYNSKPAGLKKTDTQTIVGIKYKF